MAHCNDVIGRVVKVVCLYTFPQKTLSGHQLIKEIPVAKWETDQGPVAYKYGISQNYCISKNYRKYHWFFLFDWLWSSVAMVVKIVCRDTIVLCNTVQKGNKYTLHSISGSGQRLTSMLVEFEIHLWEKK